MILSDATAISLDGREVQEVRIDGELVWTSGLWIRLSSDKSYVLAPETATITVYSPDLPSTSIGLYMVKDMTRTKLDDLTTDENGQATYTYTGTGAGEIGLVAVYDDTDSNIVTIDDYTPAVTSVGCSASITNLSYGMTVFFTATVKDQHNQNIESGTVTFKDGNTSIGTGSISNGVATLSISTLAVGSHSVTAEISNVSSTAVELTVNKASTSLTIVPPTLYYKDEFDVSGILKESASGEGIVGATVTLEWNDGTDHTATATTTTDGAYTFHRDAPTSIREYTFKVSFAGDTSHNSSATGTSTVTVNKELTVLAITSPSEGDSVGSDFALTGTLKDDEGNVLDTSATVEVYNSVLPSPATLLGTASVGSDGSFSYTVSASSLGTGSNMLIVMYSNSTNYSASLADVTVTKASFDGVSMEKSAGKQILSYADYSAQGNTEYCTVRAQLKNGSSAANISGVTVTFNKVDSGGTVISQLGTGTTDSNGQASYTYTSVGAGDVRVRADVGSLLSETFVVHDYLFAPSLATGTSFYQISGTTSIANGEMSGGSARLTSAWDNTVDWELTFDAKISGTNCAYWIIDPTDTARDTDCMKLVSGTTPYSIVNGSDTHNYGNMGTLSSNTYYSYTIKKQDGVLKVKRSGNSNELTVSWSLLSTLSTLAIGVDTWGHTATIKNIVVKPL